MKEARERWEREGPEEETWNVRLPKDVIRILFDTDESHGDSWNTTIIKAIRQYKREPDPWDRE